MPTLKPRRRQAVAVETSPQPVATIVKRVPRDNALKSASAGKAGVYRVIHGRIQVPRPYEAWHFENGKVNPNEPKTEYAIGGDEVQFGDDDAYRLLEAGVIEPLDAKPSKVGKVWEKPKTIRNPHAPLN